MPTDAADVCSWGKTGSDRRIGKPTRLTHMRREAFVSQLNYLWIDALFRGASGAAGVIANVTHAV